MRSLLPKTRLGRNTVHEEPGHVGPRKDVAGLEKRQGSLATRGTGEPLRDLGKALSATRYLRSNAQHTAPAGFPGPSGGI